MSLSKEEQNKFDKLWNELPKLKEDLAKLKISHKELCRSNLDTLEKALEAHRQSEIMFAIMEKISYAHKLWARNLEIPFG